jgi:hypothetical protein
MICPHYVLRLAAFAQEDGRRCHRWCSLWSFRIGAPAGNRSTSRANGNRRVYVYFGRRTDLQWLEGIGGASARFPDKNRLAGGGRRIRTCMGLFLSRNLFLVFAGSLFGAGKGRSSSRRLRSGSRSARNGSRDRNASKAWRLAA